MAKIKEIVYMIADELHLNSDDSSFNKEHILFLINNYRSMLLKQQYSKDIKKPISESNLTTLCITLQESSLFDNDCSNLYLRSTNKVPNMMMLYLPKVYPIDYFTGTNITYINRDRMRYVGYNKWMNNIIYCTLGPDNYLYFKSNNPQFKYLQNVKVTALISDLNSIHDLLCNENKACDIFDMDFPLDSSLIPNLISLVVKELRETEYLPSDEKNDANDNLNEVRNGVS